MMCSMKNINKALYNITITETNVDATQAENGKPFTMYHEDKENVTFCTIKPPYQSTGSMVVLAAIRL